MSSRRGFHPLRDLALAASTLTALPVRVAWPEGERVDAPAYYPLVGLAPGGASFGLVWLLRLVGWAGESPLVFATLLVALQALLTRMLHWDGLSDVSDGYWAADPKRRLEIMSDSATGAFGVTAVVLVVLLQVTATARVLETGHEVLFVAIAVFGRLAATFGAWLGVPAKPTGLGASVAGRPKALAAMVTLAAVSGAVVLALAGSGTVMGAVLASAGVVLALGVPHVISKRFGGITGDVLGASVVIVEALLLALAAMAR